MPWREFRLNGPDSLEWDEKAPAWQILGKLGESVGLKWGVVKGGKRSDLGHFEYKGS